MRAGQMGEETFQTLLDPDRYYKGLARQDLDFHQAIGELIDNAISARKPKQIGQGLEHLLVEITIEDLQNNTYLVQVADHGTGIRKADLLAKVFNPGGQGSQLGALNEHGFGLKNALALLTGGNERTFELFTRAQDDAAALGDHFYAVKGPLGTTMVLHDDATSADWGLDLHHLADVVTGTKVRATVDHRYFRTVYRRGLPGFAVLVERLGEHLGVMHRDFLSQGNEIRLAYRRKGEEWTHHSIPAIPVPFEGEKKTIARTLTVGANTYSFEYTRGLLDYNVKGEEAKQEKGWPYPLRIYYQGSNARCGIDIVVRDRVIKSGVFEDVWPDIPKTVDFNRFVGELRVGPEFHTTNNKTGLDPHGENWEELLGKLRAEAEFQPEKTTRSESEKSLREKLVTILKGTFTGALVAELRKVWGGAGEIDIYLDVAADNRRVYELKVTEGRLLDVYQLLMGWDGLVKEGIQPTIGILVCKDYSALISDAVNEANKRTDSAGQNYKIELRKIEELIPT
jgi:Histidine kinase-, DNA gyrase B-, and HSP90-like ATPase